MESIEIFVVKKKKRQEVIKIFSKDKTGLWSLKKIKEKQMKNIYKEKLMKMRGENLCNKYV